MWIATSNLSAIRSSNRRTNPQLAVKLRRGALAARVRLSLPSLMFIKLEPERGQRPRAYPTSKDSVLLHMFDLFAGSRYWAGTTSFRFKWIGIRHGVASAQRPGHSTHTCNFYKETSIYSQWKKTTQQLMTCMNSAHPCWKQSWRKN